MVQWRRGVLGGGVALCVLFVANVMAASMAYRTPVWLGVIEVAAPVLGGVVAAWDVRDWRAGAVRGGVVGFVLLAGGVVLLVFGPTAASLPGVGSVPGLEQTFVGFSQLTGTALVLAFAFLLVVGVALGALGGALRAVVRPSSEQPSR